MDREFRKSEDAPTSPQTVPRLAAMTAARPIPSAVQRSLSGVNTPTRSAVTVSSNLRRARRTSTVPSVACSSLRLNGLESSSSAAHTLCTDGTAYCAAATAIKAMGSPSLALSHLCCGLCE